ncbi:MAG TPA: dienelactone hydrolase family protein [Acidimicrobiales bacterium]|jgi:carboxymethylenebutenolidase|nr:dienelactone hydrolase family protein [Acidimicrobiales bacterium]
MSYEKVAIHTHDGECPAYVFTPAGSDRHPALIFFMDGLGIRPTIFDMGQRLADYGYVVLVPDLFYRAGPYEALDPKKVFASGDVRGTIGHLIGSTDNRRAAEDTESFLAYLEGRDGVAGTKVGTTGYCMGGAMSLTAAGTYPDRVAAAASFHGGNLATDSDLSPHWLAPRMAGRVYVAGADNDDSYPPEMAARLDQALSDADVDHRCEIYPEALHGWTMRDFPVFNEAAAERHWDELVTLFGDTLT